MFRGSIIAQIIAVVGAIYLAKIYGEEAFGYFGFFISITAILNIISTLQLDKCIITSNNKEDSNNWLSFIMLIIPVILLLLFLIFYLFFSLYFPEKLDSSLLFYALISSIIMSYSILFQSSFTYYKKFKTISNSKIFLTIFNVSLQLVLYSNYNLTGLIIGFIISQFIQFIYFLFKTRHNIIMPNFISIRKGIKENIGIIKFLLPSNVINGLANHLMPILILAFFSTKEAGVYFFAVKILGTPLFLISTSVSQVFFQKSSELYRNNKCKLLKLTKKITVTNLLLMLLFLIAINTIGIYILETFFKNGWQNLRIYILILSVLILARTSFTPISSLIVVLNKNLLSLYFNIYLLLVNLIAIFIGYFYGNIFYTITILSVFCGIGYLLLLLYFLNHLKMISKQ